MSLHVFTCFTPSALTSSCRTFPGFGRLLLDILTVATCHLLGRKAGTQSRWFFNLSSPSYSACLKMSSLLGFPEFLTLKHKNGLIMSHPAPKGPRCISPSDDPTVGPQRSKGCSGALNLLHVEQLRSSMAAIPTCIFISPSHLLRRCHVVPGLRIIEFHNWSCWTKISQGRDSHTDIFLDF